MVHGELLTIDRHSPGQEELSLSLSKSVQKISLSTALAESVCKLFANVLIHSHTGTTLNCMAENTWVCGTYFKVIFIF